MKQQYFPKDLIGNQQHIRIVHTGMYGMLLKNTTDTIDLLQSLHCLELVLAGSATTDHGNSTQHINAGDIQFRRSGNYHITYTPDYSSLLFFLEDSFIKDFLDQHIVTYTKDVLTVPLEPFLFKSTDFISNNAEQAIFSITQPHHFSSCVVRLSAHQVLLQILSAENNISFVSFLKYLISQQKIDLTYFMECNFRQQMSLSEMARLTGRSESAFKKEFKQRFGIAPFQWLLQRRLAAVKYGLEYTHSPVSELAYDAGFENLSHFSRAFKAQYGLSPTDIRTAQ